MKTSLLLLSFPLLLSACGQASDDATSPSETAVANTMPHSMPAQTDASARWYDTRQVMRGAGLFQQHCAGCHKPDASGTPNWRQADANGRYPPPPLNGSAHAWHHPMSVLRRTVKLGGVPLGGSMPAFGDKLSDGQIDDILAWVQSHWSDRIYQVWAQRNAKSSGSMQGMRNNRG